VIESDAPEADGRLALLSGVRHDDDRPLSTENRAGPGGVLAAEPDVMQRLYAVLYEWIKGIDAVEAKMPMSIDAKAMITGETEGMIKLVADKASGRILGVHYLADHTDTLIGIGVMMVAGEMTLTQVAKAIFPHPTQTELFGELARRLLNRLRRTAKK